MKTEFIQSATKQFEYYKLLGDKTFEQLDEEQLFKKLDDESNSIAVIIKHLHGNMKSRWTDFLTTDGEKEWRIRDAEFENVRLSKTELLGLWNEGWTCLFNVLNSLRAEDLENIIYIRNQGHSALEAINRQLAHYPYHVGQIVFLGKMLAGNKWVSLSIPKNKSEEYNSAKFSKEKHQEHFTDEILEKKSGSPQGPGIEEDAALQQ